MNGQVSLAPWLLAIRELLDEHLELWGEYPSTFEVPEGLFDAYYEHLRCEDSEWPYWLGPHLGLYYEGVELVTTSNGR